MRNRYLEVIKSMTASINPSFEVYASGTPKMYTILTDMGERLYSGTYAEVAAFLTGMWSYRDLEERRIL